jgi:predicted dehydrogenase
MKDYTRRDFLRMTTLAGAGISASSLADPLPAQSILTNGKRVGIIGLDTSHAVAFTKTLNDANSSAEYAGYKVVAAYPKGSLDIKKSVDRIAGYTEDVKKQGVQIVDSIEELLQLVDVVLLETNDGRRHLEQALPVLKAGKRLFIDKPIAASLADAAAIFNASDKYNVPVFSSSSLRYIDGIDEIAGGKIGKVIGAQTYSPCSLEPTHSDFFWYGIHGIEMLFTIMGIGCKSVTRVNTPDTDLLVGTWNDNRIGTFRGMRSGKTGYGATVFGENGILQLGEYKGYDPLLKKIIGFFETGLVPINQKETLEICAFMEAAEVSKNTGGIPVFMESIFNKLK